MAYFGASLELKRVQKVRRVYSDTSWPDVINGWTAVRNSFENALAQARANELVYSAPTGETLMAIVRPLVIFWDFADEYLARLFSALRAAGITPPGNTYDADALTALQTFVTRLKAYKTWGASYLTLPVHDYMTTPVPGVFSIKLSAGKNTTANPIFMGRPVATASVVNNVRQRRWYITKPTASAKILNGNTVPTDATAFAASLVTAPTNVGNVDVTIVGGLAQPTQTVAQVIADATVLNPAPNHWAYLAVCDFLECLADANIFETTSTTVFTTSASIQAVVPSTVAHICYDLVQMLTWMTSTINPYAGLTHTYVHPDDLALLNTIAATL